MDDPIRAMMKSDWIGDDPEEDLRGARKFLGLCLGWLPQGFLRDTVRQVSEGRSAAEAWRALEEMGGWGRG